MGYEQLQTHSRGLWAYYSTQQTRIYVKVSVLKVSSSLFYRVRFLELENKQLQDKTLKLANQIGVLERALRNLQSVCNAEVNINIWLFSHDIEMVKLTYVIMYKNVFVFIFL